MTLANRVTTPVRAVDLVDAAGIALQVEPELSLHPSGAGAADLPAFGRSVRAAADEVEAERRGGGEVDVGRGLVVERHAEHLAGVFREHVECLRRLEQSSIPDISGPVDADDAGGRTVRIDEGEIDRGLVRGPRLARVGSDGSGKSGHHRVPRFRPWCGLLCADVIWKQMTEQQQRQEPRGNFGQSSPPVARRMPGATTLIRVLERPAGEELCEPARLHGHYVSRKY